MPPEATATATATNPSPPARTSFTDLLAGDPTVTMLGELIVLAVFGFSALAPVFSAGKNMLRSIAFQMPELGIKEAAADDGDMAFLPERGKTPMSLAFALEIDRHTPADDKGVFEILGTAGIDDELRIGLDIQPRRKNRLVGEL